jgi:ornithine carbamoyltransferase
MQHFLELADHSAEEIRALLTLATHLKNEWRSGGNRPVLKGKVLGMIFQKPSLRTRVSFEVGMLHLGGSAIYLSPAEIGLGERESIADVARVISNYVQGVMARVFDHEHILELARWASVPVINGLSDYNHPCQGLADFLTILEKKGRIDSTITLAYLGDGNNVAASLIIGAAKLGVNFRIATPEGYALDEGVVESAKGFAAESGAALTITTDPQEAAGGADVLYTDTWTSMGQEEEAERRRKVFPPYQINAELLSHARGDAIVMHCLPAHRGEEITDAVADGPQSALFDQAANRLHAQKALLVKLMS